MPGQGMRLSVGQRNELEVTQTPSLKLQLSVYQEREDKLKTLWREAGAAGKVVSHDDPYGFRFDYALVKKKDVPPDIISSCGGAFAHCLFDPVEAAFAGRRAAMKRGEWLLFVVEDMHPGLPDDLKSDWARHEYVEAATAGDHNAATRVEMAVPKIEGRLGKAVDYIEAHSPEKWLDVCRYQRFPYGVPDDPRWGETVSVLSGSPEGRRVQALVESFEWPKEVLKRLEAYERGSQEAEGMLSDAENGALRQARYAPDAGMLDAKIRAISGLMLAGLGKAVKRRLDRYMAPSYFAQLWADARSGLVTEFGKTRSRYADIVGHDAYLREVAASGYGGDLAKSEAFRTEFKETLAKLVAERDGRPTLPGPKRFPRHL